MDQSYSESDISMSPSQILERLQVLRQPQLTQRGKLQKQQLQYQETTESSSCITEMISHFTNSASSTSYNTFLSLLQSSQNITPDGSPGLNARDISQKVLEKDLIDGVSMLNLSHESEFIINTPISSRSRASGKSTSQVQGSSEYNNNAIVKEPCDIKKKHISLDEMPILSPKKDFETLVIEKLENEKSIKTKSSNVSNISKQKKPFLRRGEGMARFGVKKNDLVIMSTKALPWKKNNSHSLKGVKIKPGKQSLTQGKIPYQTNINNSEHLNVDIIIPPLKLNTSRKNEYKIIKNNVNNVDSQIASKMLSNTSHNDKLLQDHNTSNCSTHTQFKVPELIIEQPKGKHPVQAKTGKTWASILTTEQSDFLMQLKQSEYYKNFASPTKSTVSDMSCDENTCNIRQEKETAEQNLFNLLENKVSNESFNMNTSFINRFLRRSHLECSGESTPIVMQKCLAENPNLMHIFPNNHRKNEKYKESDTYQSEYSECCSDACSSVSSCCSCKTVEPATPEPCKKDIQNKVPNEKLRKEVHIVTNDTVKDCEKEVDNEHEVMKANMAEMNAKLITTSELLKERLRELEGEIETFRKENINLNKMKEEVDTERQKFYEEKSNYEQKFNEEKILSEYYLAEEKDKLNKQKQMYERYVREMRGRLNKKEKDDIVNLKQEINTLKEDIRLKDAKSISTIARLRNQIKIIEKEKTELQNEVEKLKKENRRIQHSNEITRRLTNMKYLEQINKKLTNMNKETQPEVKTSSDIKYKAFEIERQSRSRKVQQASKSVSRPRAKSVPNLKVQSRYAKYFSQRDAVSDRITLNIDRHDDPLYTFDDEEIKIDAHKENSDESSIEDTDFDSDNNLEKIYIETFKSISPKSNKSAKSKNNNYIPDRDHVHSTNGFFLQKSISTSSTRDSKSPVNVSTPPLNNNTLRRTKSPVSIISHRSPTSQTSEDHCTESKSTYRSKSPASLSNPSTQRSATVIHKDLYQDKLMTISPEPTTNRTSLTKTNLNPTEYKKPDGSRELRFPNGNVKYISSDGKYCKFVYYNGDVKENFYNEGRIKYYYAESKTYHTTHPDGLEVLEFPDGQIEKRYKDGSTEVRLPNGSVRYHDPKNEHVREEWRFPDGSALTVSANGERRVVFPGGQIEVHAGDHKRREFPDGTVKLVYNDGTSETRYASGRVRIKDKHGNLIMDSATR